MGQYEIRFWLPRPRAEVFSFLADVRNLDRMTPEWLRFQVLASDPPEIRQGTVVDYRLRWRFLPMRWRSEITVWEPPHLFTYEQRRGPYRQWVHEHVFEDQDGGTRVIDRVRYSAYASWLVGGRVATDVQAIFEHRASFLRGRNFRSPES